MWFPVQAQMDIELFRGIVVRLCAHTVSQPQQRKLLPTYLYSVNPRGKRTACGLRNSAGAARLTGGSHS